MSFDQGAALAAAAALPPWDWQAPPVVVAEALTRYSRFYGLDRLAPDAAHAIGSIEVAGYRIALQSWRRPAPRGTVLVLHGYYDHIGIFDHVIERVLACGFDVLAFDLPGHGLSSGDPATIDDFGEYQAVLLAVIAGMRAARLPEPWQAVAQSTGGAILLDYLLSGKTDIPFLRAVLFAPLVRPVNWGVNGKVHALISPFRNFIARKFAINSHDAEFLHFLRHADPLQARELSVRWVGALKRWIPRFERRAASEFPLVVVQGDEDGTVDWRHNLAVIREKFPKSQLHMLPQGRHQLVNESPEFREPVLAHMEQALCREPA